MALPWGRGGTETLQRRGRRGVIVIVLGSDKQRKEHPMKSLCSVDARKLSGLQMVIASVGRAGVGAISIAGLFVRSSGAANGGTGFLL